MLRNFTILLIIVFYSCNVWSQPENKVNQDTLLVINGVKLTDEILLERTVLLNADSISTTIDSLRVKEYQVRGITLGFVDSLRVLGARITPDVKKMVKGEQYRFKFLYMEKVILVDNSNNEYALTPDKIKLTFIK